MTQISRPVQVALAAAVLAAAVYFLALRGHSSSGASQSSPSPPASAPASAASSAHGATGTAKQGGVQHASSPSVAGLDHTIEKAQGTVKAHERAAAGTHTTASHATARKPATARKLAATRESAATPKVPAPTKPASKPNALAKQKLVEGELKQGQTVIVMFWNPHASVDAAVHGQLQALQSFVKHERVPARERNITVHYSTAAEVGEYGTITRSQQVLQTPTLLVISPSGKAKTLTGFVDTYAIAQAIAEARKA